MQYDRQMHSPPNQIQEAAPLLIPFLRPRFAIERSNLEMALEFSKQIPYVPIAEHYALGLVYKNEDKLSGDKEKLGKAQNPVQQEHLNTWKMTLSDGLTQALANLRESAGYALFELVAPGVYMAIETQDNPAKLLLTDLIAKLPFRGQPVAIVPHVNQVVMAGSYDLVGLKLMLQISKDLIGGPGGMLALPIILDGDNWVPYCASADHDLFVEFDRLRLSAMSAMYGEQKELLDQLHQASGQQIWAAPYEGRAVDEFVFSQSVLPEGALPALLPLADTFEFGRLVGPDQWQTLAAARLETCIESIADLLMPMGMYPERCLIEQFPSDQQLACIGIADFQRLHPRQKAVDEDPRKIVEEVLMLPVYPNARPKGEPQEPEGTFTMDFQTADSPVRVCKFYFGVLSQNASMSVFDHDECDFVVADDLSDTCAKLMSDMIRDHWRGRTARKPPVNIWAARYMIVDESRPASRAVSLLKGQHGTTVISLSKRSYPPEVAQLRSVRPISEKSELERLLGMQIHPSATPSAPMLKDGPTISQIFEVENEEIDDLVDFTKDLLNQFSHLKSTSGGLLVERINNNESISVHIGRGMIDEIFMQVMRTKLVAPYDDVAKNLRFLPLEKKLGVRVFPGCNLEGKLETNNGARDHRFTSRESAETVSRFYRSELANSVYIPLPGLDPKPYVILAFKDRQPSHAVLVMAGNNQTKLAVRAFPNSAGVWPVSD